jgi:predicted RNase H-like nuclease
MSSPALFPNKTFQNPSDRLASSQFGRFGSSLMEPNLFSLLLLPLTKKGGRS